MPFNIVSLVMQYLTPDLIGKIAHTLGLDRTATQKAVIAMIPAILAGIAAKTTRPGGAQRISDVLARQDPGVLDKVGQVLGSPQHSALIDYGSDALKQIFSKSEIGGLAAAVARYAALGEAQAASLVGVSGPIVIGAVAKHQHANHLDAAGLADLLSEQKATIAAAVPAGLGTVLGVDTAIKAPPVIKGKDVEASSTPAYRAPISTVADMSASRGRSHWGWAAMAVLLLLGGLWWWQKSVETTRLLAEVERVRIEAAQQAALQAAARQKAEAEAKLAAEAAAKAKAEADARAKAQAEAAAAAAKLAAEAEARAKAEKAAQDAKLKAELEARQKADAEVEAARKAAAEAEATRTRAEKDISDAKQAADTAAAKAAADAAAASAAAAAKQAAEAKAAADAAAAKQAADAKATADAAATKRAADAKLAAELAAAKQAAGAKAATDAAAKAKADRAACQANVTSVAASGPVLFEFASATIAPASVSTLNRLAATIKGCPSMHIRVEGHTDADGDVDRNQRLSENRAKSVTDFLVEAGIPAERLTAAGLGQTRPIAANDTSENKARNRRIEFIAEPM